MFVSACVATKCFRGACERTHRRRLTLDGIAVAQVLVLGAVHLGHVEVGALGLLGQLNQRRRHGLAMAAPGSIELDQQAVATEHQKSKQGKGKRGKRIASARAHNNKAAVVHMCVSRCVNACVRAHVCL